MNENGNTLIRTGAAQVTGASVDLTLTVDARAERLWDAIVDLNRMGEWSPETVTAAWFNGADGPIRGSRFIGRNRYPDGTVATVTCVVTDANRPSVFGFTVLDEAGLLASLWRWELRTAPDGRSAIRTHSRAASARYVRTWA
jgi:uncharacterized protein YndB with AHSA1/START domain